MLAAISSAMATSATSTSSLLAAESSNAVTRRQFEDCDVMFSQQPKIDFQIAINTDLGVI